MCVYGLMRGVRLVSWCVGCECRAWVQCVALCACCVRVGVCVLVCACCVCACCVCACVCVVLVCVLGVCVLGVWLCVVWCLFVRVAR